VKQDPAASKGEEKSKEQTTDHLLDLISGYGGSKTDKKAKTEKSGSAGKGKK
jgi:hypothetical protein